jgi:hypothetical protein
VQYGSIKVKVWSLGRALGMTDAQISDYIFHHEYVGTLEILSNIRKQKTDRCGKWMQDKIDLAMYIEQIDILKFNPQEQKKAWHAMRIWLNNQYWAGDKEGLHPWESHANEGFGDILLDKEESTNES